MLFTNPDDFLNQVEANAAIDFLSITPSIKATESKYIKPLCGSSFYDYLCTEASHYNAASAVVKQCITLARQATANLALASYVPIAEVQITDAGLRRGNSEASPGAYKYQSENAQRAYFDRGMQYIEEMLAYFAENVADQALSLWLNTDEQKNYTALFIRTGLEFERYYSALRYPRRLYMLLRSSMINVQELQIAPAISSAIYKTIRDKSLEITPAYTTQEAVLVSYLKPAIANFTVARGIASLMATMDDNGIHLLSSNTDSSSGSSKRTSADASIISAMVQDAQNTGEAWLNNAITYLNETASATVFSTWYDTLTANATSTTDANENYQGIFSL